MIIFVFEEYNNPELLKPFDDKFDIQLLWKDIEVDRDTKHFTEIKEKIRNFYFGKNGHINNESFSQYLQYMSDHWFNYGVDQSVKAQARQSSGKTYYYKCVPTIFSN